MCGLAGCYGPSVPREQLAATVGAMIAPIRHRGPDDAGVWCLSEAGIGLGFRRLAIIDLSPNGHQPMTSAGGRFTLVFNGEVFNHQTLRRELRDRGARFRGHSDTEVILAAFEAWGVAAAVRRFVGMFAIAVWDGRDRSLTLIRDRLGIKPLHICQVRGGVYFGSELKSLAAVPGFDRTVDRAAATSFLRYLYVPSPQTIYAGVSKLPPGHLLTVRDPRAPLPSPEPYWAVAEVARAGLAAPLALTDADAIEQGAAWIDEVVRMRMEADVPLGALLSGGVDSSLVVATMQAFASSPVKTFTVGFDRPEHDETAAARAVATYLGTDHTELRVGGDEALAVVPELPDMFDEPLADPSQIPTYLISALARRSVTVALSGDGGDELFGGYNRYLLGERLLGRLESWPLALRRTAGRALAGLGTERLERLHRIAAPLLPAGYRLRLPGAKLSKLGRLLQAPTGASGYQTLMSFLQVPERFIRGGVDRNGAVESVLTADGYGELLSRMMIRDQASYLPDDLLAKVDRASMAVSLEARVPLLDHRLVEWSWRLPRRFKLRDGRGKWLLREVLYRRVPRALVEREKTGFTVPIAAWLRGPLRTWAEDLLSADRLRQFDLLEPATTQAAWQGFLHGERTDSTAIWALLMLAAWEERWLRVAPGPSAIPTAFSLSGGAS